MKLASGLLFAALVAEALEVTLGNKDSKKRVDEDMYGFGSSHTTGIGAITKFSDEKDDWAPWGVAIAGNGLMAEAAAAGVFRLMAEGGVLDKISSISSVSGGTWFTNQLAFSKEYFQGVTDPKTPIDEWYTSYQGTVMEGMVETIMSGETHWEGMVASMYTSFDNTLRDMPALQANMAGFKGADLLFSTTLLGKSLMSDGSTVVEFSSEGKPTFFSNPAYWVIPTEGFAHWMVPGVDLKNATWTAGSESTTNPGDILPEPTVTKIGSMSSAANGITAGPELSKLFEPQSQYIDTFGSGLNPDNGICTTAGFGCSFPSMMAIDGCYTDNLGFALNVGYLQRKFPRKNLRMMGISAEVCERSTDPMCIQSVNGSAFRSLFANSPYPTVEGWLPAIVPGPNRTIFAESITDEQAFGQVTGHGGMSFVTGTFTTVRNDYFGVAAGTKVAIVILNVNGPTYLQPDGPEDAQKKAGLSSVAVDAYNSVKALHTALDSNAKVTSESAFLYYQTVKAQDSVIV